MGVLDTVIRPDVRADRYGVKAAAALLPVRTALAGRSIKPFNVLVVGDSTDEGQGVGTTYDLRNQAWPERVGQLLRQRFPTIGETSGAVPPNYVNARVESVLPSGFGNSGWSNTAGFSPQGVVFRSTTAGNTLPYVIPVGTTSIDLLFVGGSAVTGFTYTIDGGAPSATVATTGAVADGKVARITGWNPTTTHTLVITSVGNNSYFDGVIQYAGNETAGVRVFNAGHSGSATSQFLNGGSFGWLSATPSATALAGTQSIIPLDPDLIIVGWGYNDFNRGDTISPAQFTANLKTITAAMRAMLPTKKIPVLYLSKWAPGAGWGAVSPAPWTSYVAAARAAAADDPLGLHLDLGNTLIQPTSALAGQYPNLYADAVHGKAQAYQAIADQVAGFIAP